MMALDSALSDVISEANVCYHHQSFSRFVSFATGNDLYAELMESRTVHIALDPASEQDERFVGRLRAYASHLEEWGASPGPSGGACRRLPCAIGG